MYRVSARVGNAVRHSSRTLGGFVAPVVPDRSNHQVDACSSDPALYTVPDAGHGGSVEHWPERSPDTKRRTVDDGKGDVVCSSNATSHADETCCKGVPKPYADP